jgi:hypothetical protein
VLDHEGRTVETYQLSDGVASVPVPDRLATVEVLDADGDTLDVRAPLGRASLTGD